MGRNGPVMNPVCCGAQVPCDRCKARDLAVCAVLDEQELQRFSAAATSARLEPGQTLFHEGEPAEEMFSLTEGMIKLYKLLQDGRRQITGFLMAGDFLGLAFGRTYVYSAEAVTPVRLCRFRRAAFLRLLEEMPHLERNLLGRASSELAAAQEQMLLLGRKTARERLATFLLAIAERQHRGDREPVELLMSRSDIADYLGLTIETVSRTLSTMRRVGAITLDGKSRVYIPDRDALRSIAGL